MPNVKNRRIVVDGETYRWSSIGDDGGIGISVALEGAKRCTMLDAVVPHNVLVLPSLVRRLIQEGRAAGWNPRGSDRYFRHALQGPFLDAPDPRKKPRREPPSHDGLLAAIRVAPDDDEPRIVYADWLLEQGDPRGEFIILQCGPDTDESKRRAAELLNEHELEWLGAVGDVTRSRQWRRGFVVEATLTRRERGVVAPAIGDARWWSIRALDARGEYLEPQERTQIMGRAGFDDLEVLKIEAAVLEQLVKEGDGWVPRELEIHSPGPLDFQALWEVTRVPRLRELRLVGIGVTVAERRSLERPTLRVSC